MAGVNTILAEILLILLVVFSLIFELALHQLEHYVHLRHSYLAPALKIIYRELMVLGFVSFIFIMYQTIFQPPPSVVHSFEFAHVFIFLLAICYTCVTLFSLYTSLRLSAKWKRMERIPLDQYLRSKKLYTDLRLRMHSRSNMFWRAFQWWFPNLPQLLRYRHLHELMAYHDMRFQFIFYRNLPETFRFHSFVRAIKTHTFLNLVHTHWTLYFGLLLISAIDITRRKLHGTHITEAHRFETTTTTTTTRADPPASNPAADDDDTIFLSDTVESAFYIAGALALMLCAQILALKIRKIYWQLTKNPRLYYGDFVEPSSDDPQVPAQSQHTRNPSISDVLGVQNPDQASAILSTDLNAAQRRRPRPPPPAPGLNKYSQKDSAVFEEDITETNMGVCHGVDAPVRRTGRGTVAFADASPDNDDTQDRIESSSESEPCLHNTKSGQGNSSVLSFDDGPADYGGNNSLLKHKSLAITSATIEKNREYHETAKQLQARKYPWIIRTLVPRVNRVSSPVEKMFWFGSHHFFFWCVQFVMFFSTVLLSAVTSAVILRAVEGGPILNLNYIALPLAVVTLGFNMVRTAAIMKKYSFVLLNASLLPESLEESTISELVQKQGAKTGAAPNGTRDADSSELETETETETEAEEERDGDEGGAGGLRRNQTIAGFMRAEAAKGNMDGIVGDTILESV